MMKRMWRTTSSERVPKVKARSIYEIESKANELLRDFQPTILERPESLDVARLVDDYLPSLDIDVCPISVDDIECEAGVSINEQGADILMDLVQYQALYTFSSETWRARSTVAHEVGHAILHADELRDSYSKLRTRWAMDVESDPEWQAWQFARFLLMPRVILRTLEQLTPEFVSDIYDVSPDIAHVHLDSLSRHKLI